MTELERYLVEEVAEDHHDGIITRREAVRRLGLLGVTGAAASALLSAPLVHAAPAKRRRTRRDGTETTWAMVPTEEITFPGRPGPPLMASWAPAAKARGSLLVIHENRGLNDHIRSVASRFAAVGFSSLALDLLSEEGGTGSFPDDAARMAALSAVASTNPERFDADMKFAVGELKRRVRGKPVSAIGFCFGGGMVWRLLAAREKRLDAAAPFYGPFPTAGDLRGVKAAVLGVYAGLDDRVNGTRDAAKAAVEAARLKHEFVTFDGADHAFFNDTNPPPRYHPQAAAEAYRRSVDWFADARDRHGHGHGHDRD
jgi:carboxymethylenebutenolidase